MSFANIHGHSEYSDGLGHTSERSVYAKELGQDALGLTDHGTPAGLLEHYKACKDVNIKPVFGIEVYHQRVFTTPSNYELMQTGFTDERAKEWALKRHHLTLFARDGDGYKNLLRLTTAASKNSFYFHPIVTDDLLAEYSKGVICLTGCISGYIARHILKDDLQSAWEMLSDLANWYGENFFLEVQPFGSEEQAKVNRQMEVWSDLYHLPIVMTADSHFIRPGDVASYQVYQKMRNPKSDGWQFEQRCMPQESDMLVAYEKMMGHNGQEYINRSQTIADMCDVILETTYSLPKMPGAENEKDMLAKIGVAGLKNRKLYTEVVVGVDRGKKEIIPAYRDRLLYELNLFLSKGSAGYMLLCADIARFCKEKGILCLARGSACGSLWVYLAGISEVDPLKYDTSIDRFISPDRQDMADVDLDIQDNRKEEVTEYLRVTYGGESICTLGTFKTRGLLNKLEKVIPFENGDASLLRSSLGDLDGIPFDYDGLLRNPTLKVLDAKYGVVKNFCDLFGQVNYIGEHPAGVAVIDGDLAERTALIRVGSGGKAQLLTCYDLRSLEIAKVAKIDALGLANLTIVREAEEDAGVVFEDSWIHDREVLDHFGMGDTVGIMQMERSKPKKWFRQLAKIRPITFEDVIVINGVNRPGVQEGTFESYLERQTVHSTLPLLMFEEEVMRICREEAGLDWPMVSVIRKYLKKYQKNDITLEKIFVDGMVANGHDGNYAKNLWELMRRYLFCRAHAVSYAMLAAREMWLKVKHPHSFWLAVLRNEDNRSKRQMYMAEAIRSCGMQFLIPHVNGGAKFERVNFNNKTYIQEGLLSIDGVGETVVEAIIQEREANGDYTSLDDLIKRVPRSVLTQGEKKGVLKSLDAAGATEFIPLHYLRRVKSYNLTLLETPVYTSR